VDPNTELKMVILIGNDFPPIYFPSVEQLREMITQNPGREFFLSRSNGHRTEQRRLLVAAIGQGYHSLVPILIKAGACPIGKKFDDSPIQIAIITGAFDMVLLLVPLIVNDAKVMAHAITCAIKYGDGPTLRYIINEMKTDTRKQILADLKLSFTNDKLSFTNDKISPDTLLCLLLDEHKLIESANLVLRALVGSRPGEQSLPFIDLLICHYKVDVNVKDTLGRTPLMKVVAARCCDLDVVKNLILHGADILMVDQKENTALHLALSHKHGDVAQYLIKVGADLGRVNGQSRLPLFVALNKGLRELYDILVPLPGFHDPLYKNTSAVIIAIRKKEVDVLKLLLDRGVNPNQSLASGQTLIHIVLNQDQKGLPPWEKAIMARLLITAGANLCTRDHTNRTPISLIMDNGALAAELRDFVVDHQRQCQLSFLMGVRSANTGFAIRDCLFGANMFDRNVLGLIFDLLDFKDNKKRKMQPVATDKHRKKRCCIDLT
jgi:ankyrin repeat protein